MSTSSVSNIDNSNGFLQSEYMKPIMKYSVFFIFVIYFVAIFTIISRDPNAMDGSNRILYLFSVIGPLIFFVTIILSNMQDKRYVVLVIFMIIILLFFICRSLMPFLDNMTKNLFGYLTNVTEIPPLSIEHSFLVSIISKMLFLSIIVVFFSILISTMFHESFRQKGNIGIFMHVLLFIPCLVIDYVKYLLNEFRTTPTVVYALIALEIALIILYFFIPKIFRFIFKRDRNCIVREPIYLDRKKTVSGMSAFYNDSAFMEQLEREYNVRGPLETSDEEIPNKSLLRNYSISFWLTLNPPTLAEEEECMIFRVGNDNGSINNPDDPPLGSPYIGFKNNRLKIVCSNNIFSDEFQKRFFKEEANAREEKLREDVSCDISIPYQKWNNIVLNYRDNFVDIFLNGELVNTISLKNSLPIYTHSQTICIGSDSGKLHGAICELCVYKKCLGRTEINQQYNLLNLKNPPVNNLT